MHFRGTNAINAKITGSGIGLKLVDKLVHLHSGKINIESVEQQGTTITVVFPKGNKHFRHSNLIDPEKNGRQEAVLDAPVISKRRKRQTMRICNVFLLSRIMMNYVLIWSIHYHRCIMYRLAVMVRKH